MRTARSFHDRRTGRGALVSLLLCVGLCLLTIPSEHSLTDASPPGAPDAPSLAQRPHALPRPEMELSEGLFLVASRQLTDPRFRETVVLLTRHSGTGTVGLIVNRPTELPLSEAFPGVPSLEQRNDPVYIGGPVEAGSLHLLIRSRGRPEGCLPVLDGVFVSSSREVLERLGRSGVDGGGTFRVYFGYAGWAPGQLESEVLRGGWHVLQADAASVFERDPADLWMELIQRSSPAPRLEARHRDRDPPIPRGSAPPVPGHLPAPA